MRIAFAVFVFIHAMAHGVGFLNQTFLVGVEDRTQNPAYFLSGFARDHALVRSLGVLWLGVGIAFVIAGIRILREADGAVPWLIAATAVSMVLSIMWVREAPFGLVANAIIIAVLLVPALYDRVLAL
jgi:hypothetical protein